MPSSDLLKLWVDFGVKFLCATLPVEKTHPMSSPAHEQIVAFTNFKEEKGGGAFAEGYRFSWRNELWKKNIYLKWTIFKYIYIYYTLKPLSISQHVSFDRKTHLAYHDPITDVGGPSKTRTASFPQPLRPGLSRSTWHLGSTSPKRTAEIVRRMWAKYEQIPKLVCGFNPCENYISQLGSLPQVGVRIKKNWNHDPVNSLKSGSFGGFVRETHVKR